MPNKTRIWSPASVLLLLPLTCPSLIMRSHGYTTGVRRRIVGSITTRSTTTAPAIASHGIQQGRLRAPIYHRRVSSSSSSTSSSSWSSSASLFSSVKTGYYETTLHNDEIPLSKLLEKAAAVRKKWSKQQQKSSSEETTTTTTPSLAQLVELTSFLHNNNNNNNNRNALHSLLYFDSSYEYTNANSSNDKDDDNDGDTNPQSRRRGYANWLIPGKIMVGQYPGGVPEVSTPTREETRDHLRKVLGFRTTAGAPRTPPTCTTKVCFVSLQAEVPSQNDVETWQKRNGQIYLLNQDNNRQQQWPNPFTPYKPEVEAVLQNQQASSQKNANDTDDNENHHTILVDYWHHPIEDLSVPSNSNKMKGLLWKILQFLDNDEEDTTLVYLHCWGGRGRAGLTACCLLTLFVWAADVPETKTATSSTITVDTILEIVQTGYASRLGATTLLPPALQRSPQTVAQRKYVAHFFREVQHAAQHATTTPTRAATIPHDTDTETR